jgi:hypothetical protein
MFFIHSSDAIYTFDCYLKDTYKYYSLNLEVNYVFN